MKLLIKSRFSKTSLLIYTQAGINQERICSEDEIMHSEGVISRAPEPNAYCLFCRTGREAHVVSYFRTKVNVEVYFPLRELRELRSGAWTTTRKPLLPGYVFIFVLEADEPSLSMHPDVLRICNIPASNERSATAIWRLRAGYKEYCASTNANSVRWSNLILRVGNRSFHYRSTT
jgi:hypothetical protein